MMAYHSFYLRLCVTAGVFLLVSPSLFSQIKPEEEVSEAVRLFFKFMQKGDEAQLDSLIDENCLLTTVSDQNRTNEIIDKDQFIKSVKVFAANKPEMEERIYNLNIRTDQNLATLTADYSFFIGDYLSHCGMDIFVLSKKINGWKIISVFDTRRKEPCQPDAEKEVNRLLDSWHLAAAKADENTFFGSMAPNGIYIGTDATERWTRDEMKEWSKKYFDRESAWDFKPIERKVYFSSDQKTSWFNETLNTWMGICRGSGILTKDSAGWKIQQYHLSVTVNNDLIDGFIKLVGAPGRKK